MNVKFEHIKRYDDLFLVIIPKTETSAERSFTLTGTFFNIVDKYVNLRPENTSENRFFLDYQGGKCSIHPIGKRKLLQVAREIAKYLKLSEPARYTGNNQYSRHEFTEEKYILSINF